jgi:hypothetical protein
LDKNGDGVLDAGDPEFTPPADKVSWNAVKNTLTLRNFHWITPAPIALIIVNGDITMNLIGDNSFVSMYAGTDPSVGILMDYYSLKLTGSGSLHAQGGGSGTNIGINIVLGDFTQSSGKVTAIGETQAIFCGGNFTLPAIYNYWTSTSLPYTPSGDGIVYPKDSNPPLVNSSTYRFLKIDCLIGKGCDCTGK